MNSGVLDGSSASSLGFGEAWDRRKLNIGFKLDGIVFRPQRLLSPVQGPSPRYSTLASSWASARVTLGSFAQLENWR